MKSPVAKGGDPTTKPVISAAAFANRARELAGREIDGSDYGTGASV